MFGNGQLHESGDDFGSARFRRSGECALASRALIGPSASHTSVCVTVQSACVFGYWCAGHFGSCAVRLISNLQFTFLLFPPPLHATSPSSSVISHATLLFLLSAYPRHLLYAPLLSSPSYAGPTVTISHNRNTPARQLYCSFCLVILTLFQSLKTRLMIHTSDH